MSLTKTTMRFTRDEKGSLQEEFELFDHKIGEDDDEWGGTVLLHPDTWEGMGAPSIITVTVEPGDKLNA